MREYNEFIKNKSHLSPHTLRSYSTTISKFLAHYSVKTIEDYRRLQLIDFENYLSELPLQNSSYNAHLRNLQVFSSWLYDHKMIAENIMQNMKPRKEERKDKISLTEAERQAMISHADSLDFKLSLALMFYMGLRREELIGVKTSDIRGDFLTVLGKGKKKVKLEMPPIVKTLVDAYLSLRKSDSEYLILSKVGKHSLASSGSIYKRVKSVAKKAGIAPERVEMIAPHTLRRTFACLAVQNNVSPYIVKDMLRHSQFSTTERYLKAMGSDVANTAIRNQPMPSEEAMQWSKL